MLEMPTEDFTYDKVDEKFLTDVNLLLHFLRLSYARVEKKQNNHIVCEVFLILRELIKNHLPSLNENVAPTEEAEKAIVGILKSGRVTVEKAVSEQLKKDFQEKK